MPGDNNLRYRSGKKITLDPATLQYLKDNPEFLDRQRPGILHRVNSCLEWMQQWSVKVVFVLYVIMLITLLYWRWTSNPNLLKADRYIAINTGSNRSRYFPVIASLQTPKGFPNPFDFTLVRAAVEESSQKIRVSKTKYFGKNTSWIAGSPLDVNSDDSFIYEGLLLNPEFRDSTESSSFLRISGMTQSVESMQYKHDRVRIEQLSGSTQVVMLNSSSIDACYPHSYIGLFAGQCRVNHANATRDEFPLFGKLVDADFRPFSVLLQPGQSLEIPALWMYELITISQSVAIIREFPDSPLSVVDNLSYTSPFEGETFGWTNHRLFSALALFLAHLERRLSSPDLISNLMKTRYPSSSSTDEVVVNSCNVDGLASSGITLSQYIRKQASVAADAILRLDESCQQLAAQDFIEKIVTVSLDEGISVESFLRAYLKDCSNGF